MPWTAAASAWTVVRQGTERATAVQGIDALNHGDVGVRSLQEHAEHLTAARD